MSEIEPMDSEEIRRTCSPLWFIVDHTAPEAKRILTAEGRTMFFKTDVDANDFIMERSPRHSDNYQAVREFF